MINSLQVLRGFAAWMVVFHHYMQLFYGFNSDSLLGLIFHIRGSFGVDIFFVLSGFVMFLTSQNKNSMEFLLKRLLRVLPTYWFYTFLLLVLSVVFLDEFSFTGFTNETLLKSVLLIPSTNPSGVGLIPFLTVGWSLIFEVVFYTLLSICILASKKHAVILCIILVAVMPFIFPGGNVYTHILGEFKIYQFLCGLLIGLYVKSSFYSRANIYIRPIYQSLLLLFLAGLGGYGLLEKTLAASFIVSAFILADQYFDFSGRIPTFFIGIGDCSYSVYLSHILILGVLLHFFGNELSIFQEIGVIFLLVVLVHYASVFSHRYVENGVLTKQLNELITRKNSKKPI